MDGSTRNWLLRGALRIWLALSGRSLRVLGVGRLPGSAAVLNFCSPFRFLDALIMASVCDRPVVAVADLKPDSRSQLMLASTVNLIFCRPAPQAWHSALEKCTEVLLSGGLVLALATPERRGASGDHPDSAFVLACEAWSSAFPGKPTVVLPIHRFYPRSRHQDILIHVGDQAALPDAPDQQLDGAGSHLTPTFREVCSGSVFALQDSLLKELFGDLQYALQNRLRETWQERPAWNQSVEGFRLSSNATEALQRINRDEPETLVALRQFCKATRENRRRRSLADLQGELGRNRVPFFTRLVRWSECVLGLPLACWGLLNHLLSGFLLYVCGLAKRDRHAKAETWLARALVVLVCYGGQISLIDKLVGRADAGYYALTLPVSGAYLFRYRRLLQTFASSFLHGMETAPLRSAVSMSGKKFFKLLDQILATGTTMPLGARWWPR